MTAKSLSLLSSSVVILITCVVIYLAHGSADRPTIRVGLGMTTAEMKAGSTYRFKDEAPSFQAMPGEKIQYPAMPGLHAWIITEPYNLVLVDHDHELKRDDVGGDNYLIAITTDPDTEKVESISITFQNHPLTLDEALAEAKTLNEWFVRAGFRRPAPTAPDVKQFPDPFTIVEREMYAPRYQNMLRSYADVRAAFLDPHAEITEISAFSLASDDATVGLTITNARRWRENATGDKDESGAATEHEYFLQLGMIPRPWNRYEGR